MNFSFLNLSSLETVPVLIVLYTLLVVAHELGHFLLAKAFKMRVEEFAVGFGKRIARVGFDGQTEYNFRAFPFGGFVRIAGMEIENAAERKFTGTEDEGAKFETTNERLLEQETSEVNGVDPNGFNSRPIYQRFLVILAGPVFSFAFGWIVLCLLGVTTGLPDKSLFRVGDVRPQSVAANAGIREGDTILTINGQTQDMDHVLTTIRASTGKTLTLAIRDDQGHDRTVPVVPAADKEPGETVAVGRIGVTPDETPISFKHLSLAESISAGTQLSEGWFFTIYYLIRSGEIKNQVGGPISIIKKTHQAAQQGSYQTMSLLGSLSLSLGFANLLPVPILDGGHLLLMLLEVIRRKKLTADQTGVVFTVGAVIIGLAVVAIFFKDALALFHHN